MFTRERLAGAWEDLEEEQLHWVPWSGAHSIAKILAHVAGAEHYLGSRILGIEPASNEEDARLDRAVVASFIEEDEPFPYTEDELTPDFLKSLLERSGAVARRAVSNPTEEQLLRQFRAPLGNLITGRQALWRMAQHAGYHTGQVWTYRQHPDFPSCASH